MSDTTTHTYSGRARQPNPHDVYVGGRLRAARILAGMSQEKLGQIVGISFQQIQKYEKGLNRIGASRLQQFAQILNLQPSYFFDGMPGIEQPAEEAPRMQAEHVRLVRDYNAIPDRHVRAAVRTLIKDLAARGSQVEAA